MCPDCEKLKAQLAEQIRWTEDARQAGREAILTLRADHAKELTEANAKVAAQERYLQLANQWVDLACSSNPATTYTLDKATRQAQAEWKALAVPAAARTLLDEHARYKKALERIGKWDEGKSTYQHCLCAIAREALSTPEPPKEKP